MARRAGWLAEIARAVEQREGSWRVWTPTLDPPGSQEPESPPDCRYYLQRTRMVTNSLGLRERRWVSEPESGFASLDDLAAYLGVPAESTFG